MCPCTHIQFLELIISMKREEVHDEVEIKDNVILLHQLRILELANLNNLKSFYSRCEAQLLFNKQVRMSHMVVLKNIIETCFTWN